MMILRVRRKRHGDFVLCCSVNVTCAAPEANSAARLAPAGGSDDGEHDPDPHQEQDQGAYSEDAGPQPHIV